MKKIIILVLTITISTLTVVASTGEAAAEAPAKINRIEHVERELKRNVYAYKGEWMTGLTASYFTFTADDADYMLFVDNIDADFGMTSVKPFGAYFYRDNRAVGMRLGYSYIGGTIDTARIDLGEENDLQFDIPYISSVGSYFTAAVFHRSYTALDRNGHFGLFAEVELSAMGGSSVFEYGSGNSGIYTKSNKTSFDLSFNPGMSVFIMNNVSASVSFEFGGLNYTKVKQYDENGVSKGSRDYSGMSFKFNFLAINLGVTVHLWK
ncbi:MAG: hypothetical protein SNH35_05835 [Rikenellaceae bacterium]